MFNDINFANHMYTKISDLQLNKSINDSDNKLKYNDTQFNRINEDNNIRNDNKYTYNEPSKTDLDFLYYNYYFL